MVSTSECIESRVLVSRANERKEHDYFNDLIRYYLENERNVELSKHIVEVLLEEILREIDRYKVNKKFNERIKLFETRNNTEVETYANTRSKSKSGGMVVEKFRKSPMVLKAYLIICFLIGLASLSTIIMQNISSKIIIDPYFLVMSFLGGTGLFIVSIIAVNEWYRKWELKK